MASVEDFQIFQKVEPSLLKILFKVCRIPIPNEEDYMYYLPNLLSAKMHHSKFKEIQESIFPLMEEEDWEEKFETALDAMTKVLKRYALQDGGPPWTVPARKTTGDELMVLIDFPAPVFIALKGAGAKAWGGPADFADFCAEAEPAYAGVYRQRELFAWALQKRYGLKGARALGLMGACARGMVAAGWFDEAAVVAVGPGFVVAQIGGATRDIAAANAFLERAAGGFTPVGGATQLRLSTDFRVEFATVESASGPSGSVEFVRKLSTMAYRTEANSDALVSFTPARATSVRLLDVPWRQQYAAHRRWFQQMPVDERDLRFLAHGAPAQWGSPEGLGAAASAGIPARRAAAFDSRTVQIKRLSHNSMVIERGIADDNDHVDFEFVNRKWKLGAKLGKGSFGVVYEAMDVETGERVAAKLEVNRKGKRSKLRSEYDMMRELEGGPGIPHVHYYGVEGSWNVMVMELLDQCLKDLYRVCDKRFSLKTVVMLADQIVETLEFIHRRGYIHRDMKPQNLMMGRGDKAWRVYLIDFGLSKKFVENGAHIPFRDDKKGITGTAEYVSLATHRLVEQSRRDDMESLGYVLLKLYKGTIPWADVRRKAPNKKVRNKLIFEMKKDTELICRTLPAEFLVFLQYTIGLKFDAEPDYVYLRKLFLYLLERSDQYYDYMYDWVRPVGPRKSVAQPNHASLAAFSDSQKSQDQATPAAAASSTSVASAASSRKVGLAKKNAFAASVPSSASKKKSKK